MTARAWAGTHLDSLAHWGAAGVGYWLQRPQPLRPPRTALSAGAPIDAILVTRAMGGLGDLLMITPGLRALRRAKPALAIHLAVPRQFFALFEGNDDFVCVDIEAPTLDPARYRRWFDLTDCPAARVESRQAPHVRANRIALFAHALGLPARAVQGAAARPRYVVTDAERRAAAQAARSLRQHGRPLIGLQWRSADSYRDYPHNRELLELLAARGTVLLFGGSATEHGGTAGIHPVEQPLRRAFALAAQCDVLVGSDSAFLHLGGALALPMVAASVLTAILSA